MWTIASPRKFATFKILQDKMGKANTFSLMSSSIWRPRSSILAPSNFNNPCIHQPDNWSWEEFLTLSTCRLNQANYSALKCWGEGTLLCCRTSLQDHINIVHLIAPSKCWSWNIKHNVAPGSFQLMKKWSSSNLEQAVTAELIEDSQSGD